MAFIFALNQATLGHMTYMFGAIWRNNTPNQTVTRSVLKVIPEVDVHAYSKRNRPLTLHCIMTRGFAVPQFLNKMMITMLQIFQRIFIIGNKRRLSIQPLCKEQLRFPGGCPRGVVHSMIPNNVSVVSRNISFPLCQNYYSSRKGQSDKSNVCDSAFGHSPVSIQSIKPF